MREKAKQWWNKPILVLIASVVGGVVGAILGVFAYYGNWLG